MAVTLPLTAGVAPVDEDTDGCLLAQAIDDHRNNYDLLAATSGIEFRDDGPSRFGLEGTDHSIVYHLDDIRASGAVVYSWVGWYDGAYVNSAVKRFIALRNQGARLILGPWDHGNRQLPDPTTAVAIPSFDHHGEMLRFFDHHLKGASTGIESEPPVHYFTVGEGRWKSCDDWPPPGYDPLPLYFGPDGALGHEEPGDHSGEDTYTVDFRSSSGTGSRWRTQANFAGAVIGWPDRAEQDSRLLVYDSSPLDSDLEVTGHPHVEMHMSIDTIDTAVHAYLEEVTPQGEVRHVTEGMLRAINREEAEPSNEWDRLEPYHTFLRADARLCAPGETFTLRFGLIACSYLFRAGSRIRLALAGADADNFERIPTSGAAPNWRVQRTATYPSRVVLPARKR